jgi:hypothetical protein
MRLKHRPFPYQLVLKIKTFSFSAVRSQLAHFSHPHLQAATFKQH